MSGTGHPCISSSGRGRLCISGGINRETFLPSNQPPPTSPPSTVSIDSDTTVPSSLSSIVPPNPLNTPESTDGKYTITLIGYQLHPSSPCARRITMIFKERLDEEGYCWKNVTADTKKFYWEEFKKYFTWDESTTPSVKIAWQRKAAKRYSSLLNKIRNEKKKSTYMTSTIWEKWNAAWNEFHYKSLCEKYTKNRCSETGGPGSGPSRHTGGSISIIQHCEKMAKENSGRWPLPHEIFEKTHTRKDTSEYVDARSKNIHDRYMLLKQQRYSNEGSSEPCEVDETQLYLEAVGGEKKQRIYGLGSQAFSFCSHPSTNSFGASSHEKHEAIQDEVHRLRATVSTLVTQLAQFTQFQEHMQEYMRRMEERFPHTGGSRSVPHTDDDETQDLSLS